MTRPIDIGELAGMLSDRADTIARELFPHGRFTRRNCHVGSLSGEKGDSLAVYLGGRKPGVWKDFATGEGGDILDLVASVLFGGSKAEAVRWARSYLGLDDLDPARLAIKRRRQQQRNVNAEREAAAADRRARGHAWRIWGTEAEADLSGTPVERYLAERGIDLARVPGNKGALRYHPRLYDGHGQRCHPAMVACVTGANGKFSAVHRTYLAETAAGVTKAKIHSPKRFLGPMLGGHISISKGASKKSLSHAEPGSAVIICEGIEDALTLAMACPEIRVIAALSLGNMAAIAVPDAVHTRILVADPDEGRQQREAFARAVAAHQCGCDDVRVVRIPGGQDANGLLMAARAGEMAS